MPERYMSYILPTPEEDESIARGIAADPDTYVPTDEEFKAMRPLRGRPVAADKKILLSVRYSPDVVAYFRATGPGWQTRMNEALEEWVAGHR
ncbi:MAG: BrnA antitoxin family protein [Magnetococcales bacterium]|nr:BrnA antitoxin family protein [Magnetococcales bacterium]